jgi:hypothetical protein
VGGGIGWEGPKHVVKRGSEKCQNKHSVGIAGIDLCHIYIFVIHTQQDATHRNKILEQMLQCLGTREAFLMLDCASWHK